jgi:catechol 2,3-dioxygenase-like lactoylglutathione lyase family enzyme
MTVRLGVVGIATKDMGRSLLFYRTLGLPVPEGQEQEPHVQMEAGSISLAWDTVDLLREVYGHWEEASGHRIELAFDCGAREEVDAVYERVTVAGFRGLKEPWDAFWGQRYAVVEDPDGNQISLYA